MSDAPPIDAAFERFADDQAWGPESALRMSNDLASRLQIRSSSGEFMIQLQNGRLHYNWIKTGQQDYRRYQHVRPQFEQLLHVFRAFLQDQSLGALRPNQWEVTYVNHIPRGSVWQTPSDWHLVLPGLLGDPSEVTHARIESTSGSWNYEIPERMGRLHVNLRHARTEAGEEVLRLTLTARGPLANGAALVESLDLGRRTIVLAFDRITSEQSHVAWGREP